MSQSSISKDITEENFKNAISEFRFSAPENVYRLKPNTVEKFGIKFKEVESGKGKKWPAISIWKFPYFSSDLEFYLLNGNWIRANEKVYGKKENIFLFDDIINKNADDVYICKTIWDVFCLFETTGIIGITYSCINTKIISKKSVKFLDDKNIFFLGFDNEARKIKNYFDDSNVKVIYLNNNPKIENPLENYLYVEKKTKDDLFNLIENTQNLSIGNDEKVLNHPNPDANMDVLIRFAVQKEYDVRYNTVKNLVEFKKISDKIFKRIDDRKINDILLSLREYEELEKVTKARFNENFYSSFMGEFNPFVNYFDGLEKWDNKDYIKELSGYIKTDSVCEAYKEEYLRFWLIGCVAQCFPDDEYSLRKRYGQHGKNQYCLIFQGEQQKGKTNFFEFLASSIGHEYFYSGDIDPKNKDNQISIAENFIVHLDELSDKIRYHKTLEQYKSLIAGAQTINVRKPYDREHILLKRHASFCASINDAHGLLDDLTGARRWMILTGVDIDKQVYDLDLDKLWSQAFSLYLSGFKHWYEDPEILNNRNESYRRQKIEEELILKGIQDNAFIIGQRYTASDILIELGKKYEQAKNLSHVSIGKVCNKLFTRTRIHGRSEYTVIPAKQAEIKEEIKLDESDIF